MCVAAAWHGGSNQRARKVLQKKTHTLWTPPTVFQDEQKLVYHTRRGAMADYASQYLFVLHLLPSFIDSITLVLYIAVSSKTAIIISYINHFRTHIDSALLVTQFIFCRGQTNLDGYRASQPSQLLSRTPCQPRLERHIYAITVAISNHLTLPTLLDPSNAYYHNQKKKLTYHTYIFQQAKRKKNMLLLSK